jgi:hypothetical protein
MKGSFYFVFAISFSSTSRPGVSQPIYSGSGPLEPLELSREYALPLPRTEQSTEECCICKEEIGSVVSSAMLRFSCNHGNEKFHDECINDWIKQNYSCPICRASRRESICRAGGIRRPRARNVRDKLLNWSFAVFYISMIFLLLLPLDLAVLFMMMLTIIAVYSFCRHL